MTELLRAGSVSLTEMVRFEVLAGYRDEHEMGAASFELTALDFLEMNRAVWDEARVLSNRLKRASLPKGLPDLLIAATAIHYDAVLLHADSDFEIIAQHSDLKTESYLEYLDA